MDAATVTNQQLYLAIGVPMLVNALLLGLLLSVMNAKFERVDARFAAMDKRLDEFKELWRAELRRVEEVLDARLKHFETR